MSQAPSRSELDAAAQAEREAHAETGNQLQQAMITIDSLKQRVFDLNMELVDKNSALMVTQGQMREMQVAAQQIERELHPLVEVPEDAEGTD